MKFAVIGGDDRSVYLCALLRRDGHTVLPYALDTHEKSVSPEAIASAEAAILPLPCVRNGVLSSPFSPEMHSVEDVLGLLSPGTPVLAGKSEAIASLCASIGLPLADYFLREDLTVTNAALTAEGALGVMLQSPIAILGSRVLICGYGRIAQLLSSRLSALGARVTIAARNPGQRAMARACGFAVRDFKDAPGEYDFIINTVPAQVWPEDADFGSALLIELASPPYGFPEKVLGRAIIAAGLPGKTAPLTAAAAVRDAVYTILEESQWTKLE